jgi:hypothetical protein
MVWYVMWKLSKYHKNIFLWVYYMITLIGWDGIDDFYFLWPLENENNEKMRNNEKAPFKVNFCICVAMNLYVMICWMLLLTEYTWAIAVHENQYWWYTLIVIKQRETLYSTQSILLVSSSHSLNLSFILNMSC